MPTRKLTDTEIAIRICPRRLRWPESATSVVWTAAHRCIDALQDVGRKLDCSFTEATSGIACRRDQALRKLVNFQPFEIAEKALTENIDALERLSYRDPQQVQMHQTLTQARDDLREGVEATKRPVRERCKMREGTPV